MKLQKIPKLPENIKPRGRAAELVYEFYYTMQSRYAKLTIDDEDDINVGTLQTMLRNELLKPRWHGLVKVHRTADDILIFERLK